MTTETINTILSQINVTRVDLGLTHSDVAQYLEIGMNTYYRHLSHNYLSMSVEQVIKIYELFGNTEKITNGRVQNHRCNKDYSVVDSTT